MAEIYVQGSNAFSGVIEELRSLNTEFRNKTADIRAEHQNLITKWEGDASTAFEQNFHREEIGFDNFAQAVDEYIQALQEILAQYEAAEATNTNIAST